MCRDLLSIVLVACILQTVSAVRKLKLVLNDDTIPHRIDFDEWEFEEASPLVAMNSEYAWVIPLDIFLKKLQANNINSNILSTAIWSKMSVANCLGDFEFDTVEGPHVGYRRPAQGSDEINPTDLAKSTANRQRWIVGEQETAWKVVVFGGNKEVNKRVPKYQDLKHHAKRKLL